MLSIIVCLSLYLLSLKKDLNKANDRIDDLNRLNRYTNNKKLRAMSKEEKIML